MGAFATQLLPGLADPVFDTQRVFRAVLDALAQPGRVVRVPVILRPPAPLETAAAAVLLTLADFETPVWLQDPRAAVYGYVRFHCGAPLVGRPREARFAVVTDPLAAPALAELDSGDPEYPDRSTTLILQVRDLQCGSGVKLTGPGIRDAVHVAVGGLPSDFWRQWQRNHALFPCGVDVVFACGSTVMGLPRTTEVEA